MNRCIVFIVGLMGTLSALAANFEIKPVDVLPTLVRNGDTVAAHFLVINKTSSTRTGYTLGGLPTNVKQIFATNLFFDRVCGNPLTLGAKKSCILSLEITGPASFDFSLCNKSSCTSSAVSVKLENKEVPDDTFPYGSAPKGNVCVSNDYYATPETMLGSWAMLKAIDNDITSGDLPSGFKGKTAYGVGTAAVGNYYGYNNCGGGCNELNGYCFAIKFNKKTTYPYMIFQSVNIAANENSFDIYMAGGGCGAFCDSCKVFWGTDTIPWTDHILNSSCETYFANAGNIDSKYSVTYDGTAHPAKQTLIDACAFASSDVSGFNTQNFEDITFVPVTCPTAITQVTGLALPSSIQTIGTGSVSVPLIDITKLTDADFSGPTAIKTATTTQMQDCKTPSSGYCGNVASSIPNYEASISASLEKPLLTNAYCAKNPGVVGYCSWNNCGSSGSDYCNQSKAICESCGGGTWCTC